MGGLSLPRAHLPREEKAEGIDAPGALEVFFPHRPAHRGLVDRQLGGYVGQTQGAQAATGTLKKTPAAAGPAPGRSGAGWLGAAPPPGWPTGPDGSFRPDTGGPPGPDRSGTYHSSSR